MLKEEVGIKVGTTPLTRNFSLPYITVCPRFKKSKAVGSGNSIFHHITAEEAVDAGRGARDVTPLVETTDISKIFRFHHKAQCLKISQKSLIFTIIMRAKRVTFISKFSCLFTFVLRMSAVCLHLWNHRQLFVYIYETIVSCLFTL